MKYKFYTTSEKAWVAMLEVIRQAQKSIYLESFILSDDERTHNFFETLKERARAGVQVKIIADRAGHLFWGSFDKASFEKAGIEVLFFTRWFYHTHRKILIVDESIAFIGGVNISGAYANWLDLHIRIAGVFVRQLLRSYAKIYALAGGEDPALLRLRYRSGQPSKFRTTLYKTKLWLIERWPLKGRSAFKDYYKKKCAEAGKSIVIATPYFLPHPWLIRALKKAAKRGVKIEIIIPRKTDNIFADPLHRVLAHSMSYAKFLFLPEMNHAKVLLMDDREGLIGSNNIDARSFDYNLEASVIFQRKDMVGDLKKILETWKKTAFSIEAIEKNYRWTISRVILRWIAKILQPIL